MARPAQPTVRSPARGLYLSQWLALLIGLVLTIAATWFDWQVERRQWEGQFEDRVEELHANWAEATGLVKEVLYSLAAFFDSSDQVDAAEFDRFTRHVTERHPYIQSLAYAPLVPRAQADRFVAAVRAEEMPTYTLRSEGDHPDLAPLLYLRPASLAHLSGYDLAAHPALRAALQRAAATGGPIAAGQVPLPDAPGAEDGYLLAMPVYGKGAAVPPGATVRPQGYVLITFRIKGMVDAIRAPGSLRQVKLELYDADGPDPARQLYGESPPGAALRRETRVEVGGRPMLAVWTAGADFRGGMRYGPVVSTAGGGLLLTLLLALVLRVLRSRAAVVERTVRERTAELAAANAELAAAQRRLQELNEGLERQVAERTREVHMLATVVNRAPDPILIADVDGLIVGVNPAAARLHGWSRAELIGQPLAMLIPPEDQAEWAALLTRVLAGEELTGVETRWLTRSGEVRHLLISQTSLRDELGAPLNVVAMGRDITPLKEAQQRLQTSLAQLELLAEVERSMLAARTRQELFDTVAETLAGRFSYDTVALLTASQTAGTVTLAAIRGKVAALVPAGFRLARGEGVSGWVAAHGETLVVGDLDADRRFVAPLTAVSKSALAVPIRSGNRVVAVIAAVSQRAHAFEPEHRSALEAISSLLALGLERVGLYEELRAKNEEMETFLFATSHDLRSPLVNVLGFSQELQAVGQDLRAWVDGLHLSPAARAPFDHLWSEDITPALRFIDAAAKKMEALVDGLLQLSRIGRQPLHYERVDVDTLVCETVDGMRAEIVAAGATVDIGSLPPVDADRARLAQIFDNLIQNAVKYLDSSRPGEIRVWGEVRDGRCHYCVADNGIGIAPEYRDEIFKPFHRLDPTDTARTRSYGLGLSIVERIVQRHRGRIRVEGEPGRGSQFWLELPQIKRSQGEVIDA